MIIAVLHHDTGWRHHVVLATGPVAWGELEVGLLHGEIDPATVVHDGMHIGPFTVALERHDDPVEVRLLADVEASRAVYADWLEDHGKLGHAELLRAQLAIVHHPPDGAAFARTSARMRELVRELPYGWVTHVARHVVELGDPSRFAFRIGLARDVPTLRLVQIWAAGRNLTRDDDTAFVPQFTSSLDLAIAQLAALPPSPYPGLDPLATHTRLVNDDAHRSLHRWLDLGPTTDGLVCFASRDGADTIVTFTSWIPNGNSTPASTRVPTAELTALGRAAIAVLARGT